MTFQSEHRNRGAGLSPCLFCLILPVAKKAQNHTRRPVFDALLLAALQHRVGFSTGNMRRHDVRELVLWYMRYSCPWKQTGPKKSKLFVLVSLRGLGQMNSKSQAL